MLIDEAETVDDAEHERLLAKAESQGSSRPSNSLDQACSTRSGCSTWRPRCPSRSTTASRLATDIGPSARPRRHRERRRPRHGRQRHRRRHRHRCRRPVPAGAHHGRQGLRSAVVRRASRRSASRCPSPATPRRPSRPRRRPPRRAPGWCAVSGRQTGGAGSRLERAVHRTAGRSRCLEPASAR